MVPDLESFALTIDVRTSRDVDDLVKWYKQVFRIEPAHLKTDREGSAWAKVVRFQISKDVKINFRASSAGTPTNPLDFMVFVHFDPQQRLIDCGLDIEESMYDESEEFLMIWTRDPVGNKMVLCHSFKRSG